jgi:electron transfer flavoprotein beta subunit
VAGDHLATADARTTAAALAEGLRASPADLVLTGLQSDDQGFGQVGVVLAELLGVPHASLAVAIESADGGLRVKRELEGGWFQWVGVPLPALVTVQSGINQLRYATLKGIMAAKKKETQRIDVAAPQAPGLRIVSMHVPERKKTTAIIPGAAPDAAQELVRRLRETGTIA